MSNEREAFEYEVGKALSLPVSIIKQARKGERYGHDFDSMSLLQPLNGWWHWWQAGREGMEYKLENAERKVEELQQKLTESERYGRQADITIENLERKVEPLAAENAGLKAVDTWVNAAAIGRDAAEKEKANGASDEQAIRTSIEAVFASIKTPATDSFMAEVRASAIDSLVDIKTKQLADMHPDTHAFGATAMSIRSQINELQVFAAQIRQEAK